MESRKLETSQSKMQVNFVSFFFFIEVQNVLSLNSPWKSSKFWVEMF